MNGLTLRISSDKKNKPIKRDIKKEDLQFLTSAYHNEDITIFKGLLSAETFEQQVQALKEIIDDLCNGISDAKKNVFIIDVFTFIFLNLKRKSPLLQSFLKFLYSAPQHFKINIQECLTIHLNKMLLETNLSFETIADYSFTLSTCLDNCNLSSFSFSLCANAITQFIETSLMACYKELLKEKAPIKKLLIINGIHCCVQAGISLCQKYPISSQINLSKVAVSLLCEADLPLDTRAASGILAAHSSINFDKKHWIEIYKFILKSDNDLGMLSFCSGLLNVLSSNDLESVININGIDKCSMYALHDTVLMIEERRASESGIVLAATRCMVLISRCYSNLSYLLTQEVLNTFLAYLWGHIEHYMDAVRHLALAALSNIISIGGAHPELGVYEAILKSITGMPVERRSKHAAISKLVSLVPVEEILSNSPGLVKALFSAALANPSSNYALNSLEALICQDLKERKDKGEWFELWLEPLLHYQLSAPLEQILTAAIRTHPLVLEHITSLGLDNHNENIEVILTCLKIGRKFNLLSAKDDSYSWKGLVNLNLLESYMYHSDDDVRLSCLSLLVETLKSTEEFTHIELNLIKTFLMYNSSVQDPAVRQKILACCKKLLTRLRDSQTSLLRKHQKNARNEMTCENLTFILNEYKKFLFNLKKHCLESLFPGSSPARRSFALGVLALMKQLGIYGDYDKRSGEILLSCLLDCYEDNKVIAKDLLSSFPPSLLNFEGQGHINSYVKHTLLLSSSIRPPDSISAGYYMSLLASFGGIVDEKVPQSTSYFCILSTLTALKNELQVAKESLLNAASSGPLYGHLFVIRHLLQALDLVEIGRHSKWCSLIKNIIEIAFDCNNVVACVVYNSSPEGHIPMDFGYSDLKKEGDPQVTSQMVLLCSWRTVKEVSLLLGELSERATVKESDCDVGLLTEDQLLAIGDHLIGLLSETKHRGAFEQAYIGFSKLAGRLWKCSTGKLNELPKKWLNETLECILVNEKLSSTRRSAGIPFIVQGLLCSEMESGSCKCLHKAMSSLLKIAKEGSSEGRLHALNILRALYRGSSLGEAVGPYVANGIATAISGFNSNTWAERNSATLLLSALMSRVFGVPRGKSDLLSWRNKMTGRLFFQRYPILYTELLSHLQASSSNQMYPALYPVLLLLGRLYPSSLEGTDSNLQLMKYVPFVMKCAESSVMKTRALAATALASLITPASYESQINQLINNILETSHENHLHGYLLMVLKLFQLGITIEDFDCDKIKFNINVWTENLLMILNSPKHSFIAKDTCIQVIIQFVLKYYDVVSVNNIMLMNNIVSDSLFHDLSGRQYGYEVFSVHSIILLFLLNFKSNNIDELHANIIKLLLLDKYEVEGVVLEFLEFISSDCSSRFCPDIHDSLKLELNDALVRAEFSENLKKSQIIGEILAKKILSSKCHHEDLVKLLKSFRFFPSAFEKISEQVDIIEFFCSLAKHAHKLVASNAITCLSNFLGFKGNKYGLKDNNLKYIANLVEDYSQPEADYQCRLVVAELLSNYFDTLIKGSATKYKLSFWISAVRLLLDENQDIRNIICSGLVGNVVPSKGLELLLQKFVDETPGKTVIFIGLFYWAVGDPLDVDSDNESAVFNKGNINMNYESLILNRLVCEHMKNIIKEDFKSFHTSNINNELSDWITARKNLQGQSIVELVNNYKRSIDDCCDLNLLLPFRPSENQRLLEKYKLNNILEALNFDTV